MKNETRGDLENYNFLIAKFDSIWFVPETYVIWYFDDVSIARPCFVHFSHIRQPKLIAVHQFHVAISFDHGEKCNGFLIGEFLVHYWRKMIKESKLNIFQRKLTQMGSINIKNEHIWIYKSNSRKYIFLCIFFIET